MSAPAQRPYLVVFALLVAATLATVGVWGLHLRFALAVGAAMAVASVKAALVALFFMHLRRERRLVYGLVLLAGFLVAALIGLVALTDRTQLARPDTAGGAAATGTL